MKQILYSGGSFVTCDHVAAELLEYGVELAGHGLAASVDIPVLLPDGSKGVGTVLLGPASQLVVMPYESSEEDLDCGDAVETIQQHRRELTGPSRTTWKDSIDSSMIDPI